MNSVTILLATYNGASYLNEQLDSLLNQTYTDWNLLVHDDNSDDNTVKIIKQYIKRCPEKIILIDDKISYNSASANFASLLKHVTTEYVMFCDQDDVWLPNKIEITLNKMIDLENSELIKKPLLVHTDLKIVDSDLNILSNSYRIYQNLNPQYHTLNRLLVQNVITGCTIIINKELVKRIQSIPREAIMHDWWIGLVATTFGEIHYITTPTILYRQHTNNDTGANHYNIRSIVRQARQLSVMNLDIYIRQANAFLKMYSKQLSTKERSLLKDFISIKKTSWFHSKYILYKHNIIKQGIARNLGLLLCP